MSLHILPRPVIGPRAQKLALYITASVVALLFVVISAIYAASEYELQRTYDVNFVSLRPATVIGSMSEGRRLIHAFGCNGCHRASGGTVADIPNVARIVAPNLTRVVHDYSDEEFVRLVRAGVKRDGTSALIMPAREYANVSDDDLATMLNYLRNAQALPDHQPAATEIRFMGRVAIAAGKVPFSAKLAPPYLAPLHRPVATPEAEGEHLVKAICSHCHEVTAEHDDGWGTIAPPLAMMGQAYPPADFRKLLRTGKALGDRDLGLMSEIARDDLSHMTDTEINAIHVYLNSVDMPE
tara:strand:+ start:3905 stop:4792 length:888 start_codon:yes stop_codon:yes gene_type:complete